MACAIPWIGQRTGTDRKMTVVTFLGSVAAGKDERWLCMAWSSEELHTHSRKESYNKVRHWYYASRRRLSCSETQLHYRSGVDRTLLYNLPALPGTNFAPVSGLVLHGAQGTHGSGSGGAGGCRTGGCGHSARPPPALPWADPCRKRGVGARDSGCSYRNT